MKYERKGKKWKDRKISRNISIRVSSLLVSFSNRRLEIVFFLSNDDVGCRKTSRKRNGIRYRHAIEADQGAASKRLSSVSRSRSRCAASTVVDVEFLRRSPGRITSTRRVSSIEYPRSPPSFPLQRMKLFRTIISNRIVVFRVGD